MRTRDARCFAHATSAGTRRTLGTAFGPLEVAAVLAVQAYGAFIWTAALSGLAGFKREQLPILTAAWAFAATQLGVAALIAALPGLSAVSPAPAGSAPAA